jgi:hypothetical protein
MMKTACVADAAGPLCKCGCGERVPRRKSNRGQGWFNRYVTGHYRKPLPVEVPLCKCGCGKEVGRKGRGFSTWIVGHHRQKHGHDRAQAKNNEYLFRKYGLTRPEYDSLVTKQDGRCGICGTSEVRRGDYRWCVDHDHSTGKIRGLLCFRCNSAIGLLDDNIGTAEKLVAYLREHKQ